MMVAKAVMPHCNKPQEDVIFDDIKDGKRLQAKVLKTIEVHELFACLKECLMHNLCKSINININKRKCELLKSSLSANKYINLKDDSGWIYYGSIKVDSLILRLHFNNDFYKIEFICSINFTRLTSQI